VAPPSVVDSVPIAPTLSSTPAAPTISLAADRTAIEEGEEVTLSWKSENVSSVRLSDVGEVQVNGILQVRPSATTTYTATAVGPGGTASDTVSVAIRARPSEPPPEPNRPVLTLAEDFRGTIEDVYFDYDKDSIRSDQTSKLTVLANWLVAHPNTRIVIEGHCDDRGGQEYNVALGDARASAAQRHLETAGISRSRLQTVSYGEERRICRDDNEDCWSRNRRAHFLLVEQ
jgi:peptidoglycan-associated lipoprotein